MHIQWLGHSAFKVSTGGAQILFDPFLSGNSSFSGDYDDVIAGTTHVLLTHGHNDHFGDTVDILKKTGATLISTPELCGYVGSVHAEASTHAMNIGGTHRVGEFSIAMVQAFHSSSYTTDKGQIIYGGMPTGILLKAGGKTLYHMGDTGAFSDMALIQELHQPDIGIVPIGDNFTMGPDEAALAVNRWFAFETVIPCHYGTFPVLEQSADSFARKIEKAEVWAPEPMGERSFG